MEEETPQASATPRRRAPRRRAAAAGKAGAGDAGIVEESKLASRAPERAPSSESSTESEAGSRDEVGMEPDARALEELLASSASVRDLERLASDNPRTAVFGALAAGFLIGFGVGLLAAKR